MLEEDPALRDRGKIKRAGYKNEKPRALRRSPGVWHDLLRIAWEGVRPHQHWGRLLSGNKY